MESTGTTAETSTGARWLPVWLLAFLIACPFLPTLAMPFDFIDDGCLVYRGPGSLFERIADRTVGEFHTRGPFRPITWFHWELQAELLQESPIFHRVARWAFCWLTAWLSLHFFMAMNLPRWCAVIATAMGLLIPFRGEIWPTLGLTEAFAMPYALAALIAAIRATSSEKPWRWDIAAWVLMALAIGCKNTMVAVLPAQLLLRAWDPMRGVTIRNKLIPLIGLGSAGLLFVAHLIAYKLDPHPKEYVTSTPGLGHLLAWGRALTRSIGLEFIGPGLALLGLAAWYRTSPFQPLPSQTRLIAVALVLVFFGVSIHLPVAGVSGRYSVVAGWGLDLLAGLFLAQVLAHGQIFLARWGLVLVACGLAVAILAGYDRMARQAARSALLWQVVEAMEAETSTREPIAWVGDLMPRRNQIGLGEGVHFGWHLKGRGRYPVTVVPVNTWPESSAMSRVISSSAEPPPGWKLKQAFEQPVAPLGGIDRCYLYHVGATP